MKKIIKSINAPAPVGPYSQAVLIDGTLFISGQVAIDMETKVLFTDNIEVETKIVMKNIKTILFGALTFPLIVPITISKFGVNYGIISALLISSFWFIAMLRTSEMPH